MTDTDRILELLQEHGSVTSYELRIWGFSGNPSQRMNEFRDRGHEIEPTRFSREGRPCCRYTLKSSGDASSLGAGGKAAGLPRLDTERAGRDDHSLPAPSQTGGGGREHETNQVDVHCGTTEVGVSRSETPAISSLFDVSGFEQGSSPYDAEAA